MHFINLCDNYEKMIHKMLYVRILWKMFPSFWATYGEPNIDFRSKNTESVAKIIQLQGSRNIGVDSCEKY